MSGPSGRAQRLLPYAASFAAGCGAAVIFWLLRTPTPVPPMIGILGLLGIAVGEGCMTRILRAIARRRSKR